jgi:hypothetical protein
VPGVRFFRLGFVQVSDNNRNKRIRFDFRVDQVAAQVSVERLHAAVRQFTDQEKGSGGDLERRDAEILIRAAQSLDYECYFALLSLHQSGMLAYDGSFGYGGSWGRRRSRWSYDNDEESEGGSPDTEFEEIFDEALNLEHWRDSEGREQSFGTIHFEDNEILGLDDKEGWSYKQEVREATGNEGASMDRWYRQAVLAIWPRSRPRSGARPLCEDCAALSRFLRDPAERVGRFPMAKQRRQHLHRQIDQHRGVASLSPCLRFVSV